MANFGADQPRQFVLDSSRQNYSAPGRFYQDNNRYVITVMLYDHSVPVTIPAGVDIAVEVRLNKPNSTVYRLDKNVPEYASIVSYIPDTNIITVDKWAAMVVDYGQILFGVTIDGISTYTALYTVDENKMKGPKVYHTSTKVDDLAKKDLSNVTNAAFKAKAKDANLLQNDLADVDVAALDEKLKETDTGKTVAANKANIAKAMDPVYFDQMLKRDAAFKALSNLPHPSTSGMTPAEIKSLFYANRYEETTSVQLTNDPYRDPKVLYLAFQLTSDDQTITQMLPPVANDQIIMVELIRSKNVTGGKIVFTSSPGDMIDGFSIPKEITEDGYAGYFLPVDNEQSYDFFGHEKTQQYALAVTDEKGNVSLGVKTLNFKGAYIEDEGDGTVHVVPENAGGDGIEFTDSVTGEKFVPKKVSSLDKSVRISRFGSDNADFAVDIPNIAEGVFAKLGYPENVNTNYHDGRPYYGAAWKHMRMYIGEDMQDKAWVIQDGANDDPNVTGGTDIRLGMFIKMMNPVIASADGYVELKVIDVTTGDRLIGDDGLPVAVRIDYKRGEYIKPELLIGSVKAKGQQKIAFEIDFSFPNQIVVLDPGCAIYIQVVDKTNVTGIAELMFCQHTGVIVDANALYYGSNWMNLAANLTKTKGELEFNAGDSEEMGNGLFISFLQKAKCKIDDNKLTVSDNGTDLPVFCVGQIADKMDANALHLKNLLTHVKIQNKDNAFVYALMKWTKNESATVPILTGYQNDQPEFADGWVKVADKFIAEDPTSDIHEDRNAFTVPDDAEQFAVILYPAVSQIPTELVLSDFEVDISPSFMKHYISTTFNTDQEKIEYDKYVYRSITKTPNGLGGFRYTINSAATKMPFGIVSGGSEIVNDRSWNSDGNTWPVEGDGKFTRDGKVTLTFEALLYCGEKVPDGGTSTCNIWLAKKQPDGSFVEIPNSKYAFVCEKSYSGAKKVASKEIKFDVKANDVVRVFAQSDIDDGCYLQSGVNGVPLLRLDITYDEIVEIDQKVLDEIESAREVKIVQGGVEVTNKKLMYDIDTNAFTVVDK